MAAHRRACWRVLLRRGLLARADLRAARRRRAGRVQGNAGARPMPPRRKRGTWKTAQPSEEAMRGEWWTIFDDSTLNDLERQAADANQNLKSRGRAREGSAGDQPDGARAACFPTIDAGFGPTREKLSRGIAASAAGHARARRRRCGARRRACRTKSICSAASHRTVDAANGRHAAERGAVPLRAARVAGGRCAELLQSARTRRRDGCVHAHGDVARRSA